MILPIDEFYGKSSGEDFIWAFMKDNMPEEWVSFHNYDFDDRQPDITLMVPNRGILIIEIKSYLAKNIRAVPDRTKILFTNKPPEGSSFDQALGYRDILTSMMRAEKCLLSDAYVTVASCYPYISETDFEAKSLNKISKRRLTILEDDFKDGQTFRNKISDIFDLAYEASKNPAKSCDFSGEAFEQIGNLISPNFRNAYDMDEKQENDDSKENDNQKKKVKRYYSKVVTFTEKVKTENLQELVDEWLAGARIFAYFSYDENVDELNLLIEDAITKRKIDYKNEEFKDFKNKGGLRFNFTYKYVKDLTKKIEVIDGKVSQEDEQVLIDLNERSNFNYLQYQVEHAPQEDMIVKAGAGTGKTYSMISRIRFLIWLNKYSPLQLIEKIVMITFTNDAADEMRKKLSQNFMNSYVLTHEVIYLEYVESIENMHISTIHSLSKAIIKKFSAYLGLGANFKITTGTHAKNRILHECLNEYLVNNSEANFEIPFYQVEKRIVALSKQLENKNVDVTVEGEYAPDFGNEESINRRTPFSELIPVLRKAEYQFRKECNENNQVALSNLIIVLGELAKKVEGQRESIDYLFVDEFQDTDDVQIKLICDYQKVFGFKVFAVGDIKQCIYRFRGAEVAAFRTLENILSSDIREYSLRKNYRTDRILLDRMNSLFGVWDRIDDISYSGDDVLIGTLDINTSLMFDRKTYSDEQERDNILKKQIEEMSLKYPNDKIAILVRTNNQALHVKELCEAIGKTVITPVGGNLFKIDPSIDLLKLLLALKYNRSASDIYNLFTTSYVNDSLDKIQIAELPDDDKVAYFYDNLPKALLKWNDYLKRLRLEPLLKVVRDIIEDVKPWGIFAEKVAPKDENEKKRYRDFYRNNLDQLFEMISLSTSFEYLTINSLIEYLEIMIMTHQEEEERSGLVQTDNDAKLFCTTVHKAKGLEYDHVILPFCADDVSGSKTRGEVDVIFAENHVGYSVLGESFESNRFVNNYYNIYKQNEVSDRRKEEIRILYVAMTRAVKSLTYYSDGSIRRQGVPSRKWEEMLEEK